MNREQKKAVRRRIDLLEGFARSEMVHEAGKDWCQMEIAKTRREMKNAWRAGQTSLRSRLRTLVLILTQNVRAVKK